MHVQVTGYFNIIPWIMCTPWILECKCIRSSDSDIYRLSSCSRWCGGGVLRAMTLIMPFLMAWVASDVLEITACTGSNQSQVYIWGAWDALVSFFVYKVWEDVIDGEVACGCGIEWDNKVEGEPWVGTKMISSSEALASASCKQWATSQMSAIQDCIDWLAFFVRKRNFFLRASWVVKPWEQWMASNLSHMIFRSRLQVWGSCEGSKHRIISVWASA